MRWMQRQETHELVQYAHVEPPAATKPPVHERFRWNKLAAKAQGAKLVGLVCDNMAPIRGPSSESKPLPNGQLSKCLECQMSSVG